jgi:hypothetical protein
LIVVLRSVRCLFVMLEVFAGVSIGSAVVGCRRCLSLLGYEEVRAAVAAAHYSSSSWVTVTMEVRRSGKEGEDAGGGGCVFSSV